jgi:glycosyltransferase 2 family protein
MNNHKRDKSSQKKWWRFLSIAFAIILLTLVLSNISLQEVMDSLATLDISILFIALLLNIAVVVFTALRWRILYNVVETPPTLGRLTKVTFVSIFFNNIFPSVVGGDAYRTLNLSKNDNATDNMERSLAIVFVDRSVGLIALMILGCFSLLFNRIIAIPPIVSILTISLLFAFITVLVLSMNQRAYQLLANCFRWLPDQYFQKIDSLLTRTQSNISVFRNHTILLIGGLIISFMQRFCWLLGAYCVALSLHLEISFITFILFMPVIEIIRLIPITIQGIGVREGLFIFFFGNVGISNSDAVLLATIIYLIPSVIGIFGGGVYLFDQLKATRSQQQETVD